MKRTPTLVFLATMLTAASQPAPLPNKCAVNEEAADMWGSPTLLAPVATGEPIEAAPGAVLALEKVQFAPRMWRTDRDLLLPPRVRFNPPAGSSVVALESKQGERRCMRDDPKLRATGLVPCLVDADGNGEHEIVELYRRDALIPSGRAKARFALAERATLATPVRLIQVPQGNSGHRMFAFRRLRVLGVEGNVLRLVNDAATQDASEYGTTITYQGGRNVIAPRRSPGMLGLPPEFKPLPRSGRIVTLSDGAVQTIDGVRFQVSRSGVRWLLTPLGGGFRTWVRLECDGARLTVG